MREERINFSYPDRAMHLLIHHFYHIGATNEIPDGDKPREMFLTDFLGSLIDDNKQFPTDLPIDFVLERFFKAILNDEAKIQGFNVKTHLEGFRSWWATAEGPIRASLKAAPLQLPPPRPRSVRELYDENERGIEAIHTLREQMGKDFLEVSLAKMLKRREELDLRLREVEG